MFLIQSGVAQVPSRSATSEGLPSAPQPQTAQPTGPASLPAQAQATIVASFQNAAEAQTGSSVTSAPAKQLPRQCSHAFNPHAGGADCDQRQSANQRSAVCWPWRNIRSSGVQAAALPTFNGAITAADANEGSRIGAGSLTASRLLEHAGGGVTLTQLITDFGRTSNLVAYSKLLEKASNANGLATTEDIVLATDQAFYNALQAEALLKVAQQTVTTRGSVQHQIDELTKSKLKSGLDLSFADVNLSQAKLLQLDAENNVNSTIAALTAVLGFDKLIQYQLTEEETQLPSPPPDVDVLIDTAVRQRPDLQALTYDQQAAEKFHRAQRDQLLPTISALGIAGVTPVRPDCFGDGCFPNYFISSWYGGIGVNMNIPIFNGFLYAAEASEAKYRAKAATENTRDLRDQVVRDVRTAWLAANTSFQRVSVAAELVKQADLSLNLAQGRYNLGLGSIVELSQAQLQQTDAAIGYVNAQYQYRLALSTLNFEIGVQP